MAFSADCNMNESQGITQGISSSDTYGGSETIGSSTSRSHGQNQAWSHSENVTVTNTPIVWQHLKWDVSSRTFRSVQEQIFMWTKFIDGQPDRHCLARLAGIPMPIPLVTATVKRVPATEQWIQRWVSGRLAALPFVLSREESAARMAAHDRELQLLVSGPHPGREPNSFRRRIRPV